MLWSCHLVLLVVVGQNVCLLLLLDNSHLLWLLLLHAEAPSAAHEAARLPCTCNIKCSCWVLHMLQTWLRCSRSCCRRPLKTATQACCRCAWLERQQLHRLCCC